MRMSFLDRLRVAWSIATGTATAGVMWRCVWSWGLTQSPCSCPRTGQDPTGVQYGGCGWIVLRNVGDNIHKNAIVASYRKASR